MQDHFGSSVQAVVAAGVLSCQVPYMLQREKEAFSPFIAYHFEIICCNSLLCTLSRQCSHSNMQPTDNTNEQRVELRMQVLLWTLYFIILPKGNSFSQVLEGIRLVTMLSVHCLFPIFWTFWLISVILRAYISWSIHQRGRDRDFWWPQVCEKLQ